MKPFLLATLALLAFTPQDAAACSCAPTQGPPITPKMWFDRFDGAVFRGIIVKSETVSTGKPEPDAEQTKLTFRIERHWKGITEPEIIVWADAWPSSCSTDYPLNRPVMIAAFRWNGRFVIPVCNGLPVSSSEMEKILGKGSPPPKGPSLSDVSPPIKW